MVFEGLKYPLRAPLPETHKRPTSHRCAAQHGAVVCVALLPHHLAHPTTMASLTRVIDGFQAGITDADSKMARWAGVQDQGAGAGVLAALSSLAAIWVASKFLLRCRLSLKLRRMSRTVPSLR